MLSNKKIICPYNLLNSAIKNKGADAGIVDPITTSAGRSLSIDIESKPVELAMELLQGNDDFAMKYITAFRNGDLE